MTAKTTEKTTTERPTALAPFRPRHSQLSIVNCQFPQFLKLSLTKLLLPALFLTSPLLAQGGQGMIGRTSPPLKSESLRFFGFQLNQNSLSLALFDTGDEAWRCAFEKLLAEDSKLSELPFLLRREGMGVAVELYKQEKWASGPRWALIDWNSKVHASGNSIPTSKELVDALDFSGIKTSVQRLKDFIRLNPDNIDAKKVLMSRLGEIASRRTAVALDITNKKPLDMDAAGLSLADSTGMEFSSVPTEAEYTAPPAGTELSDSQDYQIWGEYLTELNKMFQNNNWSAIGYSGFHKLVPKGRVRIELVPTLAKYSPLCRSAFTRNLPNVEAFLKAFPTHGAAWGLWIAFIDASGGDLLSASDKLLEVLTPLPWDALDWPPPPLQAALFKRAIEDENWDYIIKYGDDRWDMVVSGMMGGQKHVKVKPRGTWQLMTEHVWASLAAPLLEAHLAKGNLKQAEEIMEYWKLCDGWAGALSAAAALAEKYRYDALARSFAAK
jgi:hypothetical protein